MLSFTIHIANHGDVVGTERPGRWPSIGLRVVPFPGPTLIALAQAIGMDGPLARNAIRRFRPKGPFVRIAWPKAQQRARFVVRERICRCGPTAQSFDARCLTNIRMADPLGLNRIFGCHISWADAGSWADSALGPTPASRRVSQGLETTTETNTVLRPRPASCRGNEGLRTGGGQVVTPRLYRHEAGRGRVARLGVG